MNNSYYIDLFVLLCFLAFFSKIIFTPFAMKKIKANVKIIDAPEGIPSQNDPANPAKVPTKLKSIE
jgi:hypothetical protein